MKTSLFVRTCTLLGLSSLALATGVVLSSVAGAQDSSLPDRIQNYGGRKYTPQEIENTVPTTPNPWLSLRAEANGVDWNYWRMNSRIGAQKRAAMNAPAQVRMTRERAADPDATTASFGTNGVQEQSIEITGSFDLPPPLTLIPLPEDEGSIPLATDTGLVSGNAVVVDAEIGDGPFGSSGTGSGDLDFYAIRNVKMGQVITVDLDTPIPFGPLDPYVEIYSSNGTFIAANDDGQVDSFDSFLSVNAPADDDYFVSIAGFGTFILADPFDSSSGLGNIFGLPLDEGVYTATIGLDYFDEQRLQITLERGVVFGASINGVLANLALFDKTGTERQGSTQDLSFITPITSPLPSGLASVGHVADENGPYGLRVRGLASGAFSLQLVGVLPTLRGGIEGDMQTIFIDFDGATVDLADSLAIGAPPGIFVVTLSPLSSFLPNWGLTAADEDEVIDAILGRVFFSLLDDIRLNGRNPDFRIQLLNSRDHQDPFGMPNVSRVIVGGTIPELGIGTIGIAQSIDVGNFDTNETAFVLLDLLSSTNPFSTVSLNNTPRDPSASIIDVIGAGVGEIVAHEAGHYLGNWHTDQFNAQPNIMDQGGNLNFSILGLGPDGIFGTADDVDVMFVRDEFVPTEGFTGIENAATTIAFGATQPAED